MKYEACIKAHQGRECIMHTEPETRDGMITKYGKLEMRAVIADITDAGMLNMVYEVGIEDFQGRKLIMYEKPELRDGILKNNSKPVIKTLGEADFENILDSLWQTQCS
jgi:hypothetical protein